MLPKKTHRHVKDPSLSGRFVADYMAASDRRRRSILRACKFPPIARALQHEQAITAISQFFVAGGHVDALTARATALRSQMADDDFGQHVLDVNADYLDRFAATHPSLVLPNGEIIAPGPKMVTHVSGVKVSQRLAFRMRRPLKNNKAKLGGAMLRYAKGSTLDPEVAKWQSAFLCGLLRMAAINDNEEIESKMCITIDGHAGIAHAGPGDSIKRFNNIVAALTTISEQWVNIPPPAKAIL